MKRLMISMLLCCTPLAFGLIGELLDDVEHGVAHVAHATHNALHHVGRHDHIVVPVPGFKVEPRGVQVYFNNVAPIDNGGILYKMRVLNNQELELKHPDFTALFSFNAATKMLKTQVFAQEQELDESDHHVAQRFERSAQEVDFMLKSPINITEPKIEYDEPTGVLTVFFAYK